ncbi:hypothetical protein JST97_32635 [bacterium]|nr:hypothetical protein [bacterium]
MLDDYLQQLVDEGDLDSQGRITLDASKAREKLAASRFSLSSEALLAVIAASLLGGARQVKVACFARGWTISSDARPPEPGELANLMQDMFRHDQAPVWKELALALNSLYPKFCASLELVSGARRGWFEKGEWKVQPIPVPEPGWVLQLTHHPSLRQWWRWLTRRWARISDLQILQARTRWSPAPVLFEEKGQWRSSFELDPPLLPDEALATMHIQCPISGLDLPDYANSQQLYCHHRVTRARTTLRCAILPGDPRSSQLLLVYRGLTLARQHLVGNVVRFHGVINTDSLDLDASRQHIVENKRLRQRVETVRQWVLEGTAAWVRQLNPEGLQPELHAFLLELLNRINLSQNQKALLEALDRMPLLTLGDGSYASLGEMRQSLERFPALHYGPVREIHDRPVLHPESNLKKLSRIFRVPTLDVTPWLKLPELPQPVRPIVEQFAIRGPNWEALVELPRDYSLLTNRVVMRRKGVPFGLEGEPLFRTPTCFHIFLDGEFDGALDVAQKQLLEELKAAILEGLEDWLKRLRASASDRLVEKISLEHYASLLCLWMRGGHGKHRRPPEHWLDYAAPVGGFELVDNLGTMIKDPRRMSDWQPESPMRKLAEWL